MGCTRCGTDTRLIELMFNKLIQEALKDGTVQAGLVDCNEKRLEKNMNVITCHGLEDAVCNLIKNGEICLNEPIALHYDMETGKLSIGMSNGEVLETTLELKDSNTRIDSLTITDKGTLKLTDTDGGEFEAELAGLKTKLEAGDGIAYDMEKGTISVKTDGETIRVNDKGELEIIKQGCTTITDLNDLPFTHEGVFCIKGEGSAANLPVRIQSKAASQPRGENEEYKTGQFDWTGYVVRSSVETVVYVHNQGYTWSSSNDAAVANGDKVPTTGWKRWTRVENEELVPTNTVQVTNAFGNTTLFYASPTEQ